MLYKVFDFASRRSRRDGPAARGSRHLRRHAARGGTRDSPRVAATRYPVYRESLDQIVGILTCATSPAMHDRGIANTSRAIIRPRMSCQRRRTGSPLADFRREAAHGGRRRRVRRDGGLVMLEDMLGDRRRDRGRVRSARRVGRAGRRRHGPDRRHLPIDDFNERSGRSSSRRTTTRWPASSSALSDGSLRSATRSGVDRLRLKVLGGLPDRPDRGRGSGRGHAARGHPRSTRRPPRIGSHVGPIGLRRSSHRDFTLFWVAFSRRLRDVDGPQWPSAGRSTRSARSRSTSGSSALPSFCRFSSPRADGTARRPISA